MKSHNYNCRVSIAARRLHIRFLFWLQVRLRALSGCCFVLLLVGSGAQAAEQQFSDLGKHSAAQWDQILAKAAGIAETGRKISQLSYAFIDTPYRENSLIGSPERDEVLVMDLSGVDCFTLLDYVETFRRSEQLSAAIDNLKQVRYRDGQVTYRHRNHFFSDWPLRDAARISDVTIGVGQGRAMTVSKQLNRKQDGSLWLVGIPVIARPIDFIPTAQIDQQVIDALRTGDYLGIYSDLSGLDVSHTGIIIKTGGRTLLRHASSRNRLRRVVDSDLLEYLKGKPGVIVYRSR